MDHDQPSRKAENNRRRISDIKESQLHEKAERYLRIKDPREIPYSDPVNLVV